MKGVTMNVNDLLQLMVKRNISDIHFKAGSPPMLRFNGKLMAAESSQFIPAERQYCLKLAGNSALAKNI